MLTKKLTNHLEVYAAPLVYLAIRLYMANIFFTSGWLKFKNYLDGNWDLTVYLFSDEYKVPFISPEIAAVMGTAGELVLSTLLAFGLFSRFAALGLLFMTAVIEFTYKDLEIHYYWAMLFAVILVRGAGFFSLDRIICGKCRKTQNNVDNKV